MAALRQPANSVCGCPSALRPCMYAGSAHPSSLCCGLGSVRSGGGGTGRFYSTGCGLDVNCTASLSTAVATGAPRARAECMTCFGSRCDRVYICVLVYGCGTRMLTAAFADDASWAMSQSCVVALAVPVPASVPFSGWILKFFFSCYPSLFFDAACLFIFHCINWHVCRVLHTHTNCQMNL